MDREDLQIGVRVVISCDSVYYHQINRADNTIGTIEEHPSYAPQCETSDWFWVRFDNGYENCYQVHDLVIVDDENKPIIREKICLDCKVELTQIADMFECSICGSLYTDRMEQLKNVI